MTTAKNSQPPKPRYSNGAKVKFQDDLYTSPNEFIVVRSWWESESGEWGYELIGVESKKIVPTVGEKMLSPA